MQQQKNLVLFFVLSFAIFVGWSALQTFLWPPPKRVRPQPPLKLPNEQFWGGMAGLLAQPPAVPGLGAALPLVGDVAVAEWSAGDREQWKRIAAEPKPLPKPERPKVAAAKPEKFTLGDDTQFNLQVTFTTQGGAVARVILNKFEEATRLGLPAKPPQRLHLIPEDDESPSNLLYHYAEPSDKRPLDTLGTLNWTVQ